RHLGTSRPHLTLEVPGGTRKVQSRDRAGEGRLPTTNVIITAMKLEAGKQDTFGELIHTPDAVRPLSKSQQLFRTLLEKVESLRASIDIEEAELDAALAFYTTELVPRLATQTAVKKDLVRSLAPFVNKSFFPNRDERLRFKDIMRD